MNLEGTAIAFDRGEDFFALFRSYAREYWVFAILNDDRSIVGMASLSRFKAQVDSSSKWIGYLGDLRLDAKANRQAHLQWREAYGVIIRHLEDPDSAEHCEHLITAVFQENLRALKVFKGRIKSVTYHELCSYWNLSIFQPLSLSSPTSPPSVSETDRTTLECMKRPTLSLSELALDSSSRPVLARDGNGGPVLGAVLWNSRGARALQVINLPWALRLGFRVLSVFSKMKYAENQPWQIKSLSQISTPAGTTKRQTLDALGSMIRYCLKSEPRDFHILNLTLMDSDFCSRLHRRFPVSKVTAGTLFEVTSSSRAPALQGKNLVFEGAFL